MKRSVVTLFPLLLALTALTGVVARADSQFTVGLNFTGSNISQSGFIPPDTDGAVGTSDVMELLNGRYAVYNKATGALRGGDTLNSFWTANNGVSITGFAFDPRIMFDASTDRWYASSLENAGGTNNHFLLGVSATADPLGAWNRFAIPTTGTSGYWGDFDGLGFNKDGVYLTANMVNASGWKTAVVSVPKASLLAGNINSSTNFGLLNPNATGFSIKPVVDLDNGGTPEYLLSAYNTNSGWFARSTITGAITSPTLNAGDKYFTGIAYSDPINATQLGTATGIDPGDTRLSSTIVLQNGNIWGVQTVLNGGRDALRWFRASPTGAILEEGLIADATRDFIYGSIAVSEDNHVTIGFTGSGPTGYASSYVVFGSFNGSSTSLGTPTLLKSGSGPYVLKDSNGFNRWGDYSATVLDPSDPDSFWTFQEFASGTNQWSVQITHIATDEPDDGGRTPELPPSALLSLCALPIAWPRLRRKNR